MSKLPEKIETTFLIDGYFEVERQDRDVLDELVIRYNQLIEYLADNAEEDK